MAKKAYIGINGVAQEVAKGYIGIPNFEKRDLPDGYTQVADIRSSGTQYINTHIKPNQTTKIVMGIQFTNSSAGETFAFGARNSSSEAAYLFGINPSAKTYRLDYSATHYQNKQLKSDPCAKRIVTLENGVLTQSTGETLTATQGTFQCSYDLCLFAVNLTGTVSLHCSAIVDACQIWHNGAMVRDYVPCINSSGEVGLYDMVEGTFEGNAGSGTFTAGSSNRIECARKIKKAYIGVPNFTKRNLPEGYTQVEYIQSSGTQYIDTGFTPNQDTSIFMDAIPVSIANNTVGCYFFGSAYPNYTNLGFETYVYSNVFYANYQGKSNNGATTISNGERLRIEFDKNVCNVFRNGVNVYSVTHTYTTGTSGTTLQLFTLPRSGRHYGVIKVYSCQIYDNGTLVRDYVPCKNADGTVGLYDMVEGKFYANAGSGSFTAGTSDYVSTARLFFESVIDIATMNIGYTGKYTDAVVIMSGKQYRLLTLTSTGTLTLEKEVNADVWLCNGGANGGAGSTSSPGAGGAGGKFNQANKTFASATVTVASAGGTTNFVSNGATLTGSKAGGGGGAASRVDNGYGGTGGSKAASDTRPFVDSYFTSYPCAGGGGGGSYNDNARYAIGGDGGSSQSAGQTGNTGHYGTGRGGSGGVTGGGSGGNGEYSRATDGTNAVYYGSGGGGGGAYYQENRYDYVTYGGKGNGYQGIVYIRIPLEQSA